MPNYVVLQVVLKEKLIGTGSGNLSELEKVINAQAAKGYRLHTITTSSSGSKGFQFCENQFCKGVLTLYFDDIIREVDGAVLFTDEMADQIIAFVLAHRSVETLLVHCYGGQSRSRAVGAFAVEMLGGNSERYFETGSPNQYVYDVLETAWIRRQLGAF